MSECIFCRIVSGEIPATEVGRTEDAVAFRDLNPQAPVHVLIIPTRHAATAADLEGLGEDVRKRVFQHSGLTLEWEIMRVGEPAAE